MAAAGIGFGVVTLANLLLTVYDLLSTARSFGRDFGDLDFQLRAENLCLEKWAEAQVLDYSDRSDGDVHVAIDALARISTVLTELLEYSSECGVPDNDCSTEIRAGVRALYQSKYDSLRHTQESPSPIQRQLSQDGVELTQSSLSSLYQIRPELENEVERLKISTESLQKALPTMNNLRWAFVDRDKFKGLIGQLKEYNETLNRTLPVVRVRSKTLSPRGIQSAAPDFTLVPQLPVARSHMFSGREDIISTIYSTLKGSTTPDGEVRLPTEKVVVLHGLGGMGKSSIALEYSFRYSDSYTAVLWVDVTSAASLARSARAAAEHIIDSYAKQRHSYEDIALMLGLGGVLNTSGKISSDNAAEERLAGAVKRWLGTKDNEGWLLILDNYDDVDAVDIHLLLPTCDAGNVIITSRKSNLRSLGKTVAIEEIDEKAAMVVLAKSVGKEVLEGEELCAAKQVAVKLGFLPLALTQAGSYISHMQISFQHYLNLLDGESRRITTCGGLGWSSHQRTADLNRNILTTWEVTFAMLSRPAQELLLLCGFLANTDIPDKLFLQERKLQFDWVEEGVDWLTISLAELFSFSLAKRKASPDAFWIHPVVHFWARERLDTEGKQRKTQEALILVGGIPKKKEDKSMNDWAFEKRIWYHIETVRVSTTELSKLSEQPEGVFHAALNIGNVYVDHGFYSEAEKLFQWSFAGQRELLGNDHFSTLNAAHRLGIVFDAQGEYSKALEWYQMALNRREKILGKDDPDTLNTVHKMADVFKSQGEYSKALEWYQRALDGREKTLGKGHPSTLITVNNMASVFNSQGDYSKALEWYQRALDGCEKTLGKDHPSTLDTVDNMAGVFDSQGESSKALEWYQKALDGREKTLGKDHPSTLDTVDNMAGVFEREGQYPKALERYLRALDGREKTLGKGHPDTLTTVNNLANVFNSQGEYSKALECYQRALGGREKTLGKDHPHTRTSARMVETLSPFCST